MGCTLAGVYSTSSVGLNFVSAKRHHHLRVQGAHGCSLRLRLPTRSARLSVLFDTTRKALSLQAVDARGGSTLMINDDVGPRLDPQWCCLFVLDSVTSKLQCIRRPRPREKKEEAV
jgi:hypothetical protein